MASPYNEIEPNGFGETIPNSTFDQEILGAISSVDDIDLYAYRAIWTGGITSLTISNSDSYYSKITARTIFK